MINTSLNLVRELKKTKQKKKTGNRKVSYLPVIFCMLEKFQNILGND